MTKAALLLALAGPLVLAAPLVLGTRADAATLKPFSTLTGPTVRLSDLWDGVVNDKTLAPAPAPGGRITVPAAQLAAIARDYGVDWRPGSPGDRAILDRPGRTLTRDDVRPAIAAALPTAGIAADADLELGALTADPVPADAKLDFTVARLDVDAANGRLSATVTASAPGILDIQLRLTGHVQEMTEVPVLRRRLLPGDLVTAADLGWARIRTALARRDVVRAPADAIGLAARHTLQPEQPIQAADLGRATVVQKGDVVTLTLETPGLTVTARALATEPGGIGDHIRVLNEAAKVTVEAELIAPGRARVVPGTARPATRMVAAR